MIRINDDKHTKHAKMGFRTQNTYHKINDYNVHSVAQFLIILIISDLILKSTVCVCVSEESIELLAAFVLLSQCLFLTNCTGEH